MRMEGDSIEDKLKCLVTSQRDILEKAKAEEAKALSRAERMDKHIAQFRSAVSTDKEVYKELKALSSLIHEIHNKQAILLEERKNSIDFWRHMKEKIATTGIMGAIGLLGTALWYALQQLFIHGPKG